MKALRLDFSNPSFDIQVCKDGSDSILAEALDPQDKTPLRNRLAPVRTLQKFILSPVSGPVGRTDPVWSAGDQGAERGGDPLVSQQPEPHARSLRNGTMVPDHHIQLGIPA